MLDKTRRLALYTVLGLTALMILYPPFEMRPFGASIVEYGFLFAGPATVRNAVAATRQLLGPQASISNSGFNYSLDIVRLLIQLVILWAVYGALLRTVLRRPSSTSAV